VRSLAHYDGLGLQIPKLRSLHPHPLLEISPREAKKLGLEEGSWAYIEVPTSPKKVKRKIHILNGLDDRVVCAEGLWYLPEERDREKRIWSANINLIVPTLSNDPIIRTSSARALLCKVYPARER
jgi:anaerobic selenocysteine-containing dehydrogenase